MNAKTWRPHFWPDVGREEYWDLMLRMSAFRDPMSTSKFKKIGLETWSAVNLLPPDPQGVPWDAKMATAVAKIWRERLTRYEFVVLVGQRVATAFGLSIKTSFLMGQIFDLDGITATIVPHPSGLNRWWNDTSRVRELKKCLRSVMKKNVHQASDEGRGRSRTTLIGDSTRRSSDRAATDGESTGTTRHTFSGGDGPRDLSRQE